MTTLDYGVLIAYVAAVMLVGGAFAGRQKSLREFFLGDRNIPWWAAAFSGIATILSAISYLGAPGQAFKSDLTFLQYRLATPLAIAVICFVLIPFYYRLQLYSAYEYLEHRFDLKTRLLASSLFLVLKCCFLGIGIYAPSLVVAEMTGLPLFWIVAATGVLTTLYTTMGGMRAVIWTDTLQLMVLLGGLSAAAWVVLKRIPGGLPQVLSIAGAEHKLRFLDLSSSFATEFTVWGGLIGGTFLMLSQFGVDQAELQRFLTTTSVRRGQLAVTSTMLFAAAVGFFYFLMGAALYVFYSQFPEKGGLNTHPDRVFPKFIIEELPPGLTGLVIAGVFAAAMSTISAVLNSLTTVSLSDFYMRLSGRSGSVRLARAVTVALGLLCTGIALFADRFGNLLVAATKISSFFGGSLVGVFLLGMLTGRATALGAFLGVLTGFAGVVALSVLSPVSWMWYGAFSAVLSFASGWAFSLLGSRPSRERVEGLVVGGRVQGRW